MDYKTNKAPTNLFIKLLYLFLLFLFLLQLQHEYYSKLGFEQKEENFIKKKKKEENVLKDYLILHIEKEITVN